MTRIALGCMRLAEGANEYSAVETVRAALAASVSLFDTARAYGHEPGGNEHVLSRALGDDRARARIVTKCGMRRHEGAWVPDGRAQSIAEDVRASCETLGTIDLLLLHAPDPRTPLTTSVRALRAALEAGQARAIGLCNVTRAQLDEARAIAPISAVQIALGAYDDQAARGGVLAWCDAHDVDILAHSPLGGPTRAKRLARDHAVAPLARAMGVTAQQLFLAYLLHVHPRVMPLVGASRAESIEQATFAAKIALDEDTLRRLDARFPGLARVRAPVAPPTVRDREVVLIMGIAGAGKSRDVARYPEHERLNRDERGGTLRGVVRALEERLAAGATRVVLDNTYLRRHSRSDVIATAHAHGAHVRCVFLDTPLADAQINVVSRMLGRHGRLLEPDELKEAAKLDPNMMAPTVLFRMARELERPELDEGFAEVDVVPFAREHRDGVAGAAIALDALLDGDRLRDDARAIVERLGDVPKLLFAWRPSTEVERVRAFADPPKAGRVSAIAAALDPRIDVAVCTHAAGPPVCWCRPPLPGLYLEFARRHGIEARKSTMICASPAHETMARALGLHVARC